MKVHCFQHVSFEGLGSMATWFQEQKIEVKFTRFYEEEFQFPSLSSFDLLIVMGGPMGVYENDIYPFLEDEKIFIQEAIQAGKAVLGICLGAQLIAASLGEKVYANKGIKEIGWFPVQKIENHAAFNDFPARLKVLHWHGDTFDLPKGAELIYSTQHCANQAFVYHEKVVGLQFHLEANSTALNGFLENCALEIEANQWQKTVQAATDIQSFENMEETNIYMAKILFYFLKKLV